MKFILCLIGVVILLPTAGCVGRDHRDDRDHRRHEEDRDREEHRERSQYRSYPIPGVDVTTERLEASFSSGRLPLEMADHAMESAPL